MGEWLCVSARGLSNQLSSSGLSHLQRDRVSVLAKNKKPRQQYLSPKTFRKSRTFDRSASSSPPNDGCTCSASSSNNKNGSLDALLFLFISLFYCDNLGRCNITIKRFVFQVLVRAHAKSARGSPRRMGLYELGQNLYPQGRIFYIIFIYSILSIKTIN